MKKISLFVLGVLFLAACSSTSSKLQGTWKLSNSEEFLKDENGQIDPAAKAMSDGLRFIFEGNQAIFDLAMAAITYDYTIEGDTLVLKPVKATMMGQEVPKEQLGQNGEGEDRMTFAFDGDKLVLTPKESKDGKGKMVLVKVTDADTKPEAAAPSPADALPNGEATLDADSLDTSDGTVE